MGANVLQAMYGTVDLIVFVLIGLVLTLVVPLSARQLSILMNAPMEAIDQTVSYIMSKIPRVSLFQVGLATPCATVFAIVITIVYIILYERRKDDLKN